MNSKLIVVGTISAAVGAVVSWAVTADYYDRKIGATLDQLQENDRLFQELQLRLYEMKNYGHFTQNIENLDKSQITDEVVFTTIEETKAVLESLQNLIHAHGSASRADLFELIGLSSNFQDTKHGWQNIDDAVEVRNGEYGWKLIMPPAQELDVLTSSEKIEALKDESADEALIVSSIDEVGADEGQEDEHGIRPGSDFDDVEDEGVIPPGETPAETESNLRNIIDQYVANPDDRDEFVGLAEKVESQKNEQPVVISQEEYAYSEAYDHYSKETLTYYPGHRILLDDDEEVVDAVAYVIGWRNLSDSQFGNESGHPDTVFVRNHKMETDFEIVRETEEAPPIHVQMGMDKETYRTQEAAGLIKPPRSRFRPED